MKYLAPILILILISFSRINAQQNHLMYFSYELPQANFLNPAYQAPCKWWIGIPVLSSVYINYANSLFSFNSLFPEGTGNMRNLDLGGQIDKLNRNNFIGLETHLTLFGLGYKRNNWYYNFTITEKAEIDAFLSRNYVDLVWNGNAGSIGKTIKLKNTGLYLNHYREFAFGVSKTVNENLLVGAKAKLLFGKLNVSTTHTRASLYTSEHEYYLNLNYNIEANTSLPVNINPDDITDITYNEASPASILLNRKNPGIAFDAGVLYKYNEKINLTASILDVGFIRWRSNLNTIGSNDNIEFRGLTESEYTLTDANFIIDTLDFEITPDKYFKLLPFKLNAGLQYKLHPLLNANFLITSKYFREKIINTASVMLDSKPLNWLYVTTGYTIQYGAYNNVGLGFILGNYPVQFYAFTDNLTGIIWTQTTRNINLRFGINVNLGCRTKKDKSIDDAFNGSQVPCPDLDKKQNAFKQKIEKKRTR